MWITAIAKSRIQPQPKRRQIPAIGQRAGIHFVVNVGAPDLDVFRLAITEVESDFFVFLPPLEDDLVVFAQGDVGAGPTPQFDRSPKQYAKSAERRIDCRLSWRRSCVGRQRANLPFFVL